MKKKFTSQQKRKAAEKLEALLLEGLSSGPAKPLTKDDLNEMRRVVRQRVLANKKSPKEWLENKPAKSRRAAGGSAG